jgi:ribosome-associated protein
MQLSPELTIAQHALEELKANNIVVLYVAQLTSVTSYMLICTGTSSRHVKSLAVNVERIAKENNIEILGHEGSDSAEWILVDLGSVIIHIMQAEARDFYNLENLWGNFEQVQADEMIPSLQANED